MRKGWFRAESYKMSESEKNKLSREEQSRIVEKIHVSFALVLTLLRNSVELFAERVENRASCAMVTWTILNQRVEGIDEMWVEGYRKCLYFASVSSVLCLNTVQQNSTKGKHMISRYPIVIYCYLILSYMIYCNFMLLIRSGDLVLIFGIFASICTGTWDDLRLSASLFASNSLVAWPSAVPATVFSGSPQNIKKTSSKQIDICTRWHLGPFSKFPYCSMYSYPSDFSAWSPAMVLDGFWSNKTTDYWPLFSRAGRFIMENGAKGVEVIISGKLRAQRAKVRDFEFCVGVSLSKQSFFAGFWVSMALVEVNVHDWSQLFMMTIILSIFWEMNLRFESPLC